MALRAVRLGTRPRHDRLSPSTQRAQSLNVNVLIFLGAAPITAFVRLLLDICGNTFGCFQHPTTQRKKRGRFPCLSLIDLRPHGEAIQECLLLHSHANVELSDIIVISQINRE
ncbi:MAG: hypothetical protein ACI9R3_001082 [Verrucomicrobiales bacterium]|jgi:hypothetical protein